MSRCAKGQRNGPCGGSRDARCEVDEDIGLGERLLGLRDAGPGVRHLNHHLASILEGPQLDRVAGRRGDRVILRAEGQDAGKGGNA